MEAKEEFMRVAIELSEKSAENGGCAFGAVVVKDNEVVATGIVNKMGIDPIAHGEIVAIRNACKKLDSRHLEGCVLYTTYEPCPMCASAAVWAKMKGIVFGAYIEDAKERGEEFFSWRRIDIPCREVLRKGTPKLELVGGFLREECIKLFDISG